MSFTSIDQKQGMLWLNGQFIDWSDAKIHALSTHSLHYSGAVFEGIKAYNGKIFKAKQHIDRLLHSAEVFSLQLDYSATEIIDACYETMHQNNLQNCYIRPLIWGQSTTTKIGAKVTPNILISAWEPNALISKPNNVILSSWVKAPGNSYAYHAKSSGNYSNILLSLREAQQQNYDDALMLDWRGYIAELSSSNLFFVKKGELYTPITDCFLNGITRQTVIEIAQKEQLAVQERHITLDDLKQFDECFATGTACGIINVASVTTTEEKYDFPAQQITSIIQSKYKKLVRKDA